MIFKYFVCFKKKTCSEDQNNCSDEQKKANYITIDKNDDAQIEETSFNEARELLESKKFNLKIK